MRERNSIRVYAAMAMAAAVVCKALGIPPPAHCGALSTRRRIKSRHYQSRERSFNASFKDLHPRLHHRRVNTRRVCVRGLRRGDGGKEERNNEDANSDSPSCAEIPESMSLGSPDRPEPVKEEKQPVSAGKEKPEPCRERFNKSGFQKHATSRDEDLKKQQSQQEFGKQANNSKQPDVRCRLRSLWRTVSQPQNLLAAFLSGLLLYAIALFGWQVMVVAVDVTLFVLKCSSVALVLLLMYIFLI